MSEANDPFLGYYQEFKHKIFNYLMYRLSFDRALAEDLMMDIMLKAYQHFGNFDPVKGSFKTWIFSLAHNHLVNHWRDRKKHEAVSLEAMEEEGVSPAFVEPVDDATKSFDNERIRRILSLMGDAEREVVTLRYLQELDYAEIADVLGKKEGAIRTSLSRAMDRFEQLYKKIYLSKPGTGKEVKTL